MINIYYMRAKGFNIGNDVIYLASRYFLDNAFGEPINVITFPATAKYESQYKAGLNARTVYEINQYADGLIIGSGNLYENGELDVNPHALSALEIPMMLFCLARGQIYNRKLHLVNRTDAMPDNTIKVLNQKAKWSLTRDVETQAHLEALGLTPTLGGCPTIFLDEIWPKIKMPFLQRELPQAVISIRHPNLMSVPIRHQLKVNSDIEKIIEFLRAEGYQDVRILCHDHRDNPFASAFETEGIPYMYTEDIYEFMNIVANVPLCVSYRLHATLPRISLGKSTINISYDQRAASLMKTVGLEDWNIDLFKEPNLIKAIKDRYKRMNDLWALKDRHQDRWKELRAVITRTFSQFAETVYALKKNAA